MSETPRIEMNFADFQREAARTSAAPFPERERPIVQCLALCGEAGELANLIKKAAWHGQPVARERVVDELGDVLWYVADLATHYGVTLEEIAAANVSKLAQRYPNGFVVGGGAR